MACSSSRFCPTILYYHTRNVQALRGFLVRIVSTLSKPHSILQIPFCNFHWDSIHCFCIALFTSRNILVCVLYELKIRKVIAGNSIVIGTFIICLEVAKLARKHLVLAAVIAHFLLHCQLFSCLPELYAILVL